MAQSMDYCQHCGVMIDAAYAGICEICYAIQNGEVMCSRENCLNEAIRLDFMDNPVCRCCGREE